MMKKLLLLSTAIFALSFSSIAQSGKNGKTVQIKTASGVSGLKTASTPTIVPDTLHYYLNKVFYKEGNTNINNFPFYKSAASTATGVSHMGSRFDVPPGETIELVGLEAYARRQSNSISTKNKVNIIACYLDANGMPNLNNVIDSVMSELGGPLSITNPSLIGGNFLTPKTVTTSFAVLFRNMSTIAGDTVHLFRTNGATNSSTAAAKFKYSDVENGKDYGFVRYSKTVPGPFYSTRDFTLNAGFGIGTQYEFIVAPRVSYTLQAGQIVPQGIVADTSLAVPDTFCTREIMTFTNTSSKFYEHRMFNLNPFYLKWAQGSPFLSSPPGGFSADSAITWSFEFYDAAFPPMDSRVFLPSTNNGTIMAQTDLAYYPDCFTLNELRARLRPMGAFNTVPQYIYNESFTVCLRYCNGDTVGVNEQTALNNITLYPNPTSNGKTSVSGLSGTNTILIYNVLGQTISSAIITKSVHEIDLSAYPQGTYVIRIVNAEKQSKTIKILHQN
jgi:hypothetical protein